MGTRRDDITGMERAQIAIEVMPAYRPRGLVTKLAQTHQVSRQTIYTIAAVGKTWLEAKMQPGPHGPCSPEKEVCVDQNRLKRSTVVLTEVGVSQRDIGFCLQEMLDTHLSASWVNAELSRREALAAAVNTIWQPNVPETLSGDEIYSNGSPNLLVVGNDSLYIYTLTRQPTCDGETWGCILLDQPDCPQFSSDGGLGLAAGAQAAGLSVHQLDWDHLLRPLWGQAARLESQAYAALEAVEQRAGKVGEAHTAKRLEQHFKIWEKLGEEAAEKIAQHDRFFQIAHAVDEQFALIDLQNGQVRDPVSGAAQLQALGEQLSHWKGRIYEKLASNLTHWARSLFAYQPLLQQALAPLVEQWGAPAIQALARIWQIEADQKRHAQPLVVKHDRQILWEQSLAQAEVLLGLEQLGIAWKALRDVLDRSWRGSMLAECINSLLRPVLRGRKSTDQECLELFRFLHNVRPFARGKRAHHSPAELVGLAVPDDPLTLLGLAPKCQSNSSVL
jgi:hypothetical protein